MAWVVLHTYERERESQSQLDSYQTEFANKYALHFPVSCLQEDKLEGKTESGNKCYLGIFGGKLQEGVLYVWETWRLTRRGFRYYIGAGKKFRTPLLYMLGRSMPQCMVGREYHGRNTGLREVHDAGCGNEARGVMRHGIVERQPIMAE